MTESEISAELIADIPHILKHSDQKESKVRRKVLKASLFPVYAHSFYVSPRKNKWIVLYESASKKAVGDLGVVTFVCYYNTSHGLYAIMLTYIQDVKRFAFYTPHFFSRYAQRMCLNCTGIDLIVHFFTYNHSFSLSISSEQKDDGTKRLEAYASNRDGVGMGFVTEHSNFLFKTFITYDMAKGEQIDVFAKSEQLRKEIHDA